MCVCVFFNSGPDLRNPPNRPGKAALDPQISLNNHRKSLICEAGVGNRLATLRVSKTKRDFQYKIPSKSQPR